MILSSFLIVLAFRFSGSLGQESITSNVPEASTSTTNTGVTHTIEAGKGGNTFIPDVVQANVGDTIQFDFYPLNHSVARAEYLIPCVPIEDDGPTVGFFSGFMPVDAILNDPPSWSVVVNDSYPIFYYCTAPGSCIDYGMVGVINPNASTSLETQKQLARNSTFMLQPGEAWPSEASSTVLPTMMMPTTVVSTKTTTPTAAPAATTSAAAAPSHHSGLSGGAIAGIAIAVAAVIICAGFFIWWCGRHSRSRQQRPETTYSPPQFMTYPQMSSAGKHNPSATDSPVYPSYTYGGAAGNQMAPSSQQQAVYQPSPYREQNSPLMGATGEQNIAEQDPAFMRAHSPSPPPGAKRASGIQAFLDRTKPTAAGLGDNSNRSSLTNPLIRKTGPHEMSGSGAAPRLQ